MCGINDLTSGVAVSDCMESYKRLLHSGQCHSAIQSLAAVSIMPVRSSPIDSRSHAVNREVAKFNEQLKRICSESNVKFIDVSGTFSTNGGSLPMDFTQDGLHLNAKGYRVLADRLSASINQVGQLPTP
jgi:lysophospholipase L1-like esterase